MFATPCPVPAGIGPRSWRLDARLPISESWPGHKVAQTLIVQAARYQFDGKGWAVFEELEYLSASPASHELQEQVRRILEEEFRTSNARPKPDITLVSDDGAYLKVAEIGTNRREKEMQLHDRIVWWRHCLESRGVRPIVQPLDWRPAQGIIGQAFGRAICTEPTWRESAPAGVLLYEVHDERERRVPVPVPVAIPVRNGAAAVDASMHARIRAEAVARGVPPSLLAAVVALASVLLLAEVELVVAVGMAVTAIVVERKPLNEAIRDLRLT